MAFQPCMNANTSRKKGICAGVSESALRVLTLSDGGFGASLTRLCLSWHRESQTLLLLKADSETVYYNSTMVPSWSVDARRRFLGALSAVCRIRVVQGAAGRSTWRLVDDHTTTLESAWLAFDDFIASCRLLCGCLARRNGERAIVADDRGHNLNPSLVLALRLLLLLALQTHAILDRKEEAPDSDAVPGNLDQCGLAQFTVDDGFGLAILTVEVLGHVEGVLVTTVTE